MGFWVDGYGFSRNEVMGWVLYAVWITSGFFECVCVIECVNALRMFFNFRLVIYRNIII